MVTKSELRKQALDIRKTLDMDYISDKIINALRSVELYQDAQNVMIFYPLEHEVNLLPLLEDDKNFYLPKVSGNELLVCPYQKGDELNISKFKTKEPKTAPVKPVILDLIFVPALMIDKNFYRLGYGGGFYDRFLPKTRGAIKIAPVPNKLIIDNLPVDNFDVPVDVMVDET